MKLLLTCTSAVLDAVLEGPNSYHSSYRSTYPDILRLSTAP